jgi:hypothetical protein
MTNTILISLIISINLICLCIGFILGKLITLQSNAPINEQINKSFFNKQKQHDYNQKSSNIDIDERKVVVSIKTDGLEKKYDHLGEIKQSSDNISSSIDKLKNMKGL